MTVEKIQLKHSQGKHMPNIDMKKYVAMKRAILAALKDEELTHTELFKILNRALKGKFEGSISWYGESVKLDLEAGGIIQRSDTKPQRYRLKK